MHLVRRDRYGVVTSWVNPLFEREYSTLHRGGQLSPSRLLIAVEAAETSIPA